ncbi:MAG: cysteine peptidase family C39 domain-containing protein [Coriobacteriales bacterium]|nr:cysteine peptidase family C39 domain-containing protein [Coriobacteriales bacterium]
MAQLQGKAKIKGEGVCANKIPQIMQMEALECGAACLAMVCAYYGKWLSLETVRRDCGVGRGGAKASNVARAAQAYGFDVQPYRFEPERMREKATFPCIAHWNGYHFVVVRGFRGNKALINDPARGEYACDWEAFNRSFTGICICLTPGDSFEPEGERPSIVPFVLHYLREAKAALLFVALTALISAIVGLMNPALSQVFITRLLEQRNQAWLVPFVCVLVGVAAIQIISSALNAIYLLKVQGKLDVISASDFMWKALHLPVDFYAQRSVSDISGRLSTTAGMSQRLVSLLAPIPVNLLMLVVYLIIMLCYSPALALVGVAAIAVNLLVARLIAQKRVNITRAQARDKANLNTATMAGIQTIETIKASGAEGGFFRQWSGYQAQANAQQVRTAQLNATIGIIPTITTSLANAVVLVLGILLIMRGELTVGMLLAFQGYFGQFYGPATQVISSMQTLAEIRTDMERINDVMNAPTDAAYHARQQTPTSHEGTIEFKGVSFGYTRQSPPAIQNISFKVSAGSSIALVGASGSGKSTIASLLAGLYQPWEGEVLVDGVSVSQLDRDAFCTTLAMVSQEPTVVNDSIANNIRLWDSSISDAAVVQAAHDAVLSDDIAALEDGYQHVVSEGGRDLSGGQRQRLEIARALVREPRILILDEATSALDARTEQRVLEAIDARHITRVVVAHRLSTVRDCDQIIMLDHGKILEHGTHDELMAASGAYASLVSRG